MEVEERSVVGPDALLQRATLARFEEGKKMRDSGSGHKQS